MAGKDLEKFIERYPTYIEALEMLEDKDQRIAELEQKCLLYEKEMLNCSQLENGMSLCIVQKQRIAELEQELAELKEKAIVPKFKFDEECVVIMFGSYHFHRFIAQVKDDLCLTQPYNDTEEWYYVKPEMVFKTLEEAQAKLKEIQGNE